MPQWVGFILYTVGLLGYASTVRRLGVSPYLSWITSMLVQILILYGFAMTSWLNFGIKFVTYLGIFLTVVWFILGLWKKVSLQFEGIHLFDFWMIILGLITGNALWNSPLVHYDNFSHWAVMVKFMTFTGHLPTASDKLISFTSYPPATALFITQFVHWVGFSDGSMLVGQFILIWAAAYAIFAGLRDRSRALTGFGLCFTLAISFVFNVAIRLNNLLVDYVLPIITIAALVGIFVYRKKPILLCSHVAIFSATLLLVKNSATFYVVMIALFFLYTLITNHAWKWRRILTVPIQFIATMGVGYLPFAWWNWHVKHTFTLSKHEISTQAYSKQLHGMNHQQLINISHKFYEQILNWNSLSTRAILLINVVLILTWLFVHFYQGQKNNLLGIALLR